MTAGQIEAFIAEFEEWDAMDPADPKVRNRARVLEAAGELFERHGYRKTSVDDVARQAGVAKGTVYLYFKSKAVLLMHAVAEEKRRFVSEIVPELDPASNPDPTLRLERYLAASFRLVGEMPLVSRLMSGDREMLVAMDELGPAFFDQILTVQRKFLADALVDVPGADPDTLQEDVQVILSLIYAGPQIMDGRVRGDVSVPEFARMLARLIIEGVNR